MSNRTTVCKLPGIGRTQDLSAVIGRNCKMVTIVRVRFLTKNCTSKSPGLQHVLAYAITVIEETMAQERSPDITNRYGFELLSL